MTREIDARVAREVMGIKEPRTPGKRLCSRPYSTDMNAAMEVVEKVLSMKIKKDMAFQLTVGDNDSGERKSHASFLLDRFGSGELADTPALAICLAALEAVKSDR